MNQVQDFKFLYIEAEGSIEYLIDMLARLYPLQQSLQTKLMIETALDHVGASYVYQRASEQENE